MVLQGCKSIPQKSRPIESGHGRQAVQVAIECSGPKNEFKFWCKLGWFLHGQSHIYRDHETGCAEAFACGLLNCEPDHLPCTYH